MPSIVKKIVFNIALLLLIWGFRNNIASVIEKNFIIDDSKALIVSIVSSMLMLLYYIPVLRYEKCFNEKRFVIVIAVVILYYSLVKCYNFPELWYPFPMYFLIAFEGLSISLLFFKRNIFIITICLIIITLMILGSYPILVLYLIFSITLFFVLLFIALKDFLPKNPISSKLFLEQAKGVYSQKGTDQYNRSHTITATVDSTIDYFANDKSTAIAIIGEWGSGKTAFKFEMQNQIKNNLKEDYIMFDFEAWACDTPQNIVKTFFSQYRKKIGKYIPKLNPIIKDYVFDLLDDFGKSTFKINHISKLIKEVVGIDSDDNFDYITNFLKKAQVRSYIFIDDLDRMQADEIIEVLKLVRNTANFPYTQFVLLYDKDYVVETLSGKLKNAELYLEKIINVEIPLSKIEYPVLVQSFWDKMEYNLKEYNSVVFKNSDKINNDRTSINVTLAASLKNEREVLQLCNKMKIMLDYFKNNEIIISYCDLIWICIINNKYFKLYEKIASNPEILGMSNPLVSGSEVKIDISSESDGESQQSNEDELSEIAKQLYPSDEIIKKLTKYKFSHIIEDDNRYRYFSFGYSQREFTVSDIKDNILSELKYNMTLWTLDNRYKSNISLYKNYPIAINELLSELSEIDFKKLQENIFHSLKGDREILPGDQATPAKTIDLYKDLFKEYADKWDYSIDDDKFKLLFTRQLSIMIECSSVLEREIMKEFLVKLFVNYQKKLDDEGFNIQDFKENTELAEQHEFVKKSIYDFLLTIDAPIKDCIEYMDEFAMFEHSIITKEELLTIRKGQ